MGKWYCSSGGIKQGHFRAGFFPACCDLNLVTSGDPTLRAVLAYVTRSGLQNWGSSEPL